MGVTGAWPLAGATSAELTSEFVEGKVLVVDVLTFSVAACYSYGRVGGALYIAFFLAQLAALGPRKMHVSRPRLAAQPPARAPPARARPPLI